MSNHASVDVSSPVERIVTPRVPKGSYKLRIIEEPTFKMTKPKKNKDGVEMSYPMLTFETEIVSPSTAIVDGAPVELAGVKAQLYVLFFESKKTPGAEDSPGIRALHKQIGQPLVFSRDAETGLPIADNGVPISYVGAEFLARLHSEEYVLKDDNGEPMKNPLTNEVKRGWNVKIDEVWEA